MLFREPHWWYLKKPSWEAFLLKPVSFFWGAIASLRMKRAAKIKPPFPVICIGNFTAGGTGKTPLSIFLAKELQKRGYKPIFLTRGYGSHVHKARFVNRELDTAKEVGDEPLLLSAIAPVMVATNRAKGIEAIINSKKDVNIVIMDDGLQNSSVYKDCSVVIVDGQRTFGNKHVIPSGPLRAPLNVQINFIDIIVVNNNDSAQSKKNLDIDIGLNFKGPFFHAYPRASSDTSWLKNKRVFAYSGIANPNRFFSLLENLGAHLVKQETFPDHHMFTRIEAQSLIKQAAYANCQLVTTEKDWVRLDQTEEELRKLKISSRFVPISLAFENDQIEKMLHEIETKILVRLSY